MDALQADLNAAAPTTFARFQKRAWRARADCAVGDEYVVRMPGPWDGPVRVVEVGPCSFRLATLAGHLEAGQIEFRAREDGGVGGRVRDRVLGPEQQPRWSNLLYHRLRMAKEVQAHMWISFLERVVQLVRRPHDGRHRA